VEYRLAIDKGKPTRVFFPDSILAAYQRWRTSDEVKRTVRKDSNARPAELCKALVQHAEKNNEIQHKQLCFIFEIAEGRPGDNKYQTFFLRSPFEPTDEVAPSQWNRFLAKEIRACGQRVFMQVSQECARIRENTLLGWGITLRLLKEQHGFLTPMVRDHRGVRKDLVDSLIDSPANTVLLRGSAHSGKTTALLHAMSALNANATKGNGAVFFPLRLVERPPSTWPELLDYILRDDLQRRGFPWTEAALGNSFLIVDGLDDGRGLDSTAVKAFLIGLRGFPGRLVLSARSEWFERFNSTISSLFNDLQLLDLEPYSGRQLARLYRAVAQGRKVKHLQLMPWGKEIKTPLQAVVAGRLASEHIQSRLPTIECFVAEHAAFLWSEIAGERDMDGKRTVLDIWSDAVVLAYRTAYDDPFVPTGEDVAKTLAERHKTTRDNALRILQEVVELNSDMSQIKGTRYRFYDDVLVSLAITAAALDSDCDRLSDVLGVPPFYGFERALQRRLAVLSENNPSQTERMLAALMGFIAKVGRTHTQKSEITVSNAVFLIGQIGDTDEYSRRQCFDALQELRGTFEPGGFCHIGLLYSLMILGDWSAESELNEVLERSDNARARNAKFHIGYYYVVKPSWTLMAGREHLERCDCTLALEALLRYLQRGQFKDVIRSRIYVRLFVDILEQFHEQPSTQRNDWVSRLREVIRELKAEASRFDGEYQSRLAGIFATCDHLIGA